MSRYEISYWMSEIDRIEDMIGFGDINETIGRKMIEEIEARIETW